MRLNGRVYEFASAALHRRRPCDLFHSALEVQLGDTRYVIEQAPVWSTDELERGVVGEGPVGSVWLGRCPLFRYEVRRWPDGVIADREEAVESPQRLSHDVVRAQRLLALVPQAPTATWGRDELSVGEMWNSNSVISWLLARSGHDVEAICPPAQGRPPGWDAGLVVASRTSKTLSPSAASKGATGSRVRQSGVRRRLPGRRARRG